MNKNEALELIERMPYIPTIMIANDKCRLAAFQEMIQGADPVGWVKVIKTDYIRRNDKKAKKHPTEIEEELANQAKTILYSYLAEALNIEQCELENFIVQHISESW